MVEPITTLLGGLLGSQAAQGLQAVVTGLKDGFDFLKIALGVLTAVSILAALTGQLAPSSVPFAGFAEKTVLSDYILGFPNCEATLGPLEMCALPSKKLITSAPDAFGRLGQTFSTMVGGSGLTPTNDQEKTKAFIDFISALVGVLFVWIPLTFLAIKLILAWEVGYALITAMSQYRTANLNW